MHLTTKLHSKFDRGLLIIMHAHLVGFFSQPCKATPEVARLSMFNYKQSLGDSQDESVTTIGLALLNTLHVHAIREMSLRRKH